MLSWDLNPRPSDHGSPPKTTRPGLPPNKAKYLKCLFQRPKVFISSCDIFIILSPNICIVRYLTRVENVCLGTAIVFTVDDELIN